MLHLLAACAPLHAPLTSVDAPVPDTSPSGEGSLLDGPAAQAGARSPAILVSLDEGGLDDLLTNPGEAPLVVNFWATWCGPCVREMSVFREVAADRPGARFALVSVDPLSQRERVLPFLETQAVTLPAYHLDTDDPSGLLSRVVPEWPDIIPVTLVIAPGGGIAARFHGSVDADSLRGVLAP